MVKKLNLVKKFTPLIPKYRNLKRFLCVFLICLLCLYQYFPTALVNGVNFPQNESIELMVICWDLSRWNWSRGAASTDTCPHVTDRPGCPPHLFVYRAMQDPVRSTGLVVRGVVKTSSRVNSSGQPHSIISGGVATASLPQ